MRATILSIFRPPFLLSGKICKNAQCMHERLLRTFPYSQFEAVLPRRRNNAATVIECKEDLIFCSREIRAKKFLEAPKVLRLYFDGVFANFEFETGNADGDTCSAEISSRTGTLGPRVAPGYEVAKSFANFIST